MAHARTQIRNALESALTGLTTTGTNVFANRVYVYESLPAINIMTDSEELDGEFFSGTQQQRQLNAVIEIRAKVNDTVDDTLDQIALEVETAIYADLTLGGKAITTDYVGMEQTIESTSEIDVGLASLNFQISYRVDAKASDVLIT